MIKPLLLFSFFTLLAGAVENEENTTRKLSYYLSDMKNKQFQYDYEKVENESILLRDAWIMPIRITYGLQKSNPYDSMQTVQNAAISIDQPIFKSGGIYYGIKYANAANKYNSYNVDKQKRLLIKEAISILMNIKKSQLKLKQQHLQVENKRIDLEMKMQEYRSGYLDSGFLTQAVIEKNKAETLLIDIETALESLISSFNAISDLDYESAKIPRLRFIAEDEFFKYNIDMNTIKSKAKMDRYKKFTTVAKYLPQVDFVAAYEWGKNENLILGSGSFVPAVNSEDQNYMYGIQASLPLDINSYNEYEVAQVEYLKSVVQIDDTKRELRAMYERVMHNLTNYDKRIALANDNKKLYESLSEETDVLFQAGYKTEYDLQMMKNSMNIEELEAKILSIDKQLEILDLYEKFTSEV